MAIVLGDQRAPSLVSQIYPPSEQRLSKQLTGLVRRRIERCSAMNRATVSFRALQRTVKEHGDRLPSLRSRPSLVVHHARLPRVRVATPWRRQHGVEGANTSTVIVVTRDSHHAAFDRTTGTRREVTLSLLARITFREAGRHSLSGT